MDFINVNNRCSLKTTREDTERPATAWEKTRPNRTSDKGLDPEHRTNSRVSYAKTTHFEQTLVDRRRDTTVNRPMNPQLSGTPSAAWKEVEILANKMQTEAMRQQHTPLRKAELETTGRTRRRRGRGGARAPLSAGGDATQRSPFGKLCARYFKC